MILTIDKNFVFRLELVSAIFSSKIAQTTLGDLKLHEIEQSIIPNHNPQSKNNSQGISRKINYYGMFDAKGSDNEPLVMLEN